MTKIGRDVAEEMLLSIYDDLCIDVAVLDDSEEKGSKDKLINSIMRGMLEYKDETFILKLIKPTMAGKKEVTVLEIKEPTGVQLREMSSVKKKNDDIGKAMAVLGSVTGHGLPFINKLKSRDMLTAVGVISLFL